MTNHFNPDLSPPNTMQEAVERLLCVLDQSSLDALAGLKEGKLLDKHHFGLRLMIRSAFLYPGGGSLLASSGESHPDDASLVILRAL